MIRPYPYQPGTFQPATGKQPGLETFSKLARKRFKMTNLGTWRVRNTSHGTLSVHATGAACDIGYGNTVKDRQRCVEACRFFVAHATRLGIVAIHDYAAAGAPRAWRCSRDAWKTFSQGELGPGGRWLHIELDPAHAKMSEAEYRQIWVSLPKA